MQNRNNIYLIGYRGTGKSTVAMLLAARLVWDCVDSDVCVEAKYGRTISEIFQEEGEAGFRKKEADVLADICRLEGQVVACGGGIVLRPENRELLSKSDRVVWLVGDAVTIWQRLQADSATATQRPALTEDGGLKEVQELLAQRALHYKECADLVIDTVGQAPQKIAETILSSLRLK